MKNKSKNNQHLVTHSQTGSETEVEKSSKKTKPRVVLRPANLKEQLDSLKLEPEEYWFLWRTILSLLINVPIVLFILTLKFYQFFTFYELLELVLYSCQYSSL